MIHKYLDKKLISVCLILTKKIILCLNKFFRKQTYNILKNWGKKKLKKKNIF